ncbi:MAG: histidinol-phosphatase [Oscillospiraceae bacterium]|nr:histidinol-phosphatase [Oscillospiraceae bacterium]
MIIDFHSHILPDLDDGAENVAESLRLLKMLKKDGVDIVVATPHLYPHRDSASSFLKNREESAGILKDAMKDGDYPKVVLGAEVYFLDGIYNLPLDKLCIGDTDYLLLELPYMNFDDDFMDSFANFMNSCKVKIILAHIERYFDFSEAKRVFEIISYGLPAQGNCDSLLSVRTRRYTLDLIKNGKINLLGTDLHSIRRRPPRFKEAEQVIRKSLSADVFENMMRTAEEVLNSKKDKENQKL